MVSSLQMKPDTGCLEPTNELARQPSVTESREDVNERLAKPNKWNHPRSNIIRVLTTFWVFFVMGANDAAYGVGVCTMFPVNSSLMRSTGYTAICCSPHILIIDGLN